MRFPDLKLLADENISPRVVSFLREKAIDIIDVKEQGWQGSEDEFILRKALEDNRFVLTHDSDFGMLAINAGMPCYGVIYIRIKNLKTENILNLLDKLLRFDKEITSCSIVVVEDTKVRIRSI